MKVHFGILVKKEKEQWQRTVTQPSPTESHKERQDRRKMLAFKDRVFGILYTDAPATSPGKSNLKNQIIQLTKGPQFRVI